MNMDGYMPKRRETMGIRELSTTEIEVDSVSELPKLIPFSIWLPNPWPSTNPITHILVSHVGTSTSYQVISLRPDDREIVAVSGEPSLEPFAGPSSDTSLKDCEHHITEVAPGGWRAEIPLHDTVVTVNVRGSSREQLLSMVSTLAPLERE